MCLWGIYLSFAARNLNESFPCNYPLRLFLLKACGLNMSNSMFTSLLLRCNEVPMGNSCQLLWTFLMVVLQSTNQKKLQTLPIMHVLHYYWASLKDTSTKSVGYF